MTEDVLWVEWLESYRSGSEQAVAIWVDGWHTDDCTEQWIGRTAITSSAGDLTINNLILQDNGTYTCRYGLSTKLPPKYTGAVYNLVIDGKNRVIIIIDFSLLLIGQILLRSTLATEPTD